MVNKLIHAATLFTVGTVFVASAPQLGASQLGTSSTEAALFQTGDCGSKDMKADAKDDKAPEKPKTAMKAKKGKKAKDGSCGKGSCGSKDMKKDAEPAKPDAPKDTK